MKLLRIDSLGGASGDMLLALLADLGADLRLITRQIMDSNPGAFTIESSTREDRGFSGTEVRVKTEEQHSHRHLEDIIRIIEACSISASAGKLAAGTFTRLADAEARVHGTTRDRIHFHEVGALDSIVDIIGACSGLAMLGIDAVEVSALPTGTGYTECDHGLMPVPVPATAELLKGHPVLPTQEKCEMITPTGAALLMEWKNSLPAHHQCSAELVSTGYGMGHKKMGRPNIIRGLVLSDENLNTLSDECLELQTNIDDSPPEQLAWLQKRLLESGALDVTLAPVIMKKDRPGTLLTVLCRPCDSSAARELIFRESNSLGIRETFKTRSVLKRDIIKVSTKYGDVRIKTGRIGTETVTRAPEFEDCARLAMENNVPLKLVYDAASRAFDKLQ